ncbi:hypothetical protein [Streptomyces sp. SID12488]|uniref:hypothetical protein n=1 Tax=Streptomyces sp. SID12488 TaxID=2706040 RepID=UPI0013DB31BE|nr:hypothetical protein [Streptomyces sp. SID12488]NEA61529.1 hypothetical protein [Streptomyces sp. SID12488]
MDFVRIFSDVRRRPNSYGLNGGYREFVAFINGCNAATGAELLQGFPERLAAKLGSGANLYWALLVANLASSPVRVRHLDDLSQQQQERAVAVLFDELLEFLNLGCGSTAQLSSP